MAWYCCLLPVMPMHLAMMRRAEMSARACLAPIPRVCLWSKDMPKNQVMQRPLVTSSF